MKKQQLFLAALSTMVFCAAQANAAFTAAVDLDPIDGPQSLNPNFSFGGDTTSASDSIASLAVGLPDHNSLFGGDGVTLGDTYIMSYTPGTDADTFFPAAGSILGSTDGYGTELASGIVGGTSGTYKVYITTPASENVSATSNFTVTGDGAPLVLNAVDLNSGGTGPNVSPDYDSDPTNFPFVGGANNAWFLLGSVDLTAGNTYTVTQDATANTFVSQRLAGVMWEKIPEPTSIALLGLGGLGMLLTARRRR